MVVFLGQDKKYRMASYTYAILLHDVNGLLVKRIVVKLPTVIDRIDFDLIGHNMIYQMPMPMGHHSPRHPLTAMLYQAPQSPPVSVEQVEEPQLKAFEDVADIPEQESPAASSNEIIVKEKKPWTNIVTKPAILAKDSVDEEDGGKYGYNCFSKEHYPPKSGNLFAFDIPDFVLESGSWILEFLQLIKIEMIRLRVNINIINMILETAWYNQKKRNKSGVDYTDENRWFAPLYRFIKHIDGTRKCTTFNRWHANRGENCDKRYCKFHHMCAVCGNRKHGAFNRDPEGKFVCKEVRDLVDQYEALEKLGKKPIDLCNELIAILKEHRDDDAE